LKYTPLFLIKTNKTMAKVKLTKQNNENILHHLMVNHLKGHLIKDFKDVQFDNGKDVPPTIYIVVESRVPGESVLHTNLFLLSRNYYNNTISGLIKK
jgi:hypothetical protein